MRAKISPSIAKGSVVAPPSKSVAHRFLIACALAKEPSVVHGVSDSEDMKATLDCIKALGAKVEKVGDSVKIYPKNMDKNLSNDVEKLQTKDKNNEKEDKNLPIFNCKESGSTLRFFIPIALLAHQRAKFVGAKRLVERGVDVYKTALEKDGICITSDVNALRQDGVFQCEKSTKNGTDCTCKTDGFNDEISTKNDDIFALANDINKDKTSLNSGENHIYASGTLKGGKYVLKGDVSSQYVSGLLFALPLLSVDSEIEIIPPFESKSYVDMTIDVLAQTGVEIQKVDENNLFIRGGQCYKGGEYTVEGDWSNGAFLLALNETFGNVFVAGLSKESVQGDKVCIDIFEKLKEENATIDLANCPDLAPICFVMASLFHGAKFENTRRLKIKESDRASAMAQELAKFGIEVDVHQNNVVVHKSQLKAPDCAISSHNDHRIVMALSVLATRCGAVIEGAEAVGKSYPDFFDVLKELGVECEIE